ncbi:MAG: hypothetical protein IKD09_02265 [Lentisphaeria bacterium]|nr:hypothetical protein [Lentisphaeria bacterium]
MTSLESLCHRSKNYLPSCRGAKATKHPVYEPNGSHFVAPKERHLQ